MSDSDTLRLLVDKTQYKIRLDGVAASESHQAFGTKSKQALGDKTFSKPVRVVDKGKDRYGRTIGVVWIDNRNINLEMVSGGFVWHYKTNSKNKELSTLKQPPGRPSTAFGSMLTRRHLGSSASHLQQVIQLSQNRLMKTERYESTLRRSARSIIGKAAEA